MGQDAQPDFLVPPVRRDGPIILAEPNPQWPLWYSREKDRIGGALGNRALRIEHVGSTSVPGLVAKPVIDIVLVVADSADEPAYVPDLEAVGYQLRFREPNWFEHRFLAAKPTAQIHAFTLGATEVERMLLFRDWLRSCAADRDLYQQTKRQLAAAHWAYEQDYADAKSPVIEEIIARARSANR